MRYVPIAERFLAKIEVTDGCWHWKGSISSRGYGSLKEERSRRTMLAHRFAYELFVGPIPTGKEIDHLCHNVDSSCLGGHDCRHRRCVNPDHLEATTHSSNVQSGRLVATNWNRHKTHCKRGHEFDAQNTYWNYKGQRTCRACAARYQRMHRRGVMQ